MGGVASVLAQLSRKSGASGTL